MKKEDITGYAGLRQATKPFVCYCSSKERLKQIIILANGDIEVYICKACGLIYSTLHYNYEWMMKPESEIKKEEKKPSA